MTNAPGSPGIAPRWTSSAKSGVGTALSPSSPLWFTLSHGIVNEVYYPRLDSACTRDMGVIVTGPGGYFSEEKRSARHVIDTVEDGVPDFRLTNTAEDGAYRIEKRVLSDAKRPVLLAHARFAALREPASAYRLYALLSPHLVNAGSDNTAWIEEYRGERILFASGRGVSLAFAASPGWKECSVGFVGVSDGWQQLRDAGKLEPAWDRAEGGNVALTGEIDLRDGGEALLALGFGPTPHAAADNALASLDDGLDAAARAYARTWRGWQKRLKPLDRVTAAGRNTYRISTSVLSVHRSFDPRGAAVASLSIPWGDSKGDDDLGGYHLVWPRDLVETAGGFLAAGATGEALDILAFLRSTQDADGHWPQNMWLDGRPYWTGVQMDETGFPILLADMLRREGALGGLEPWTDMIVRAAGYIARNGPVTGEDRWEEDAGYSPFTLAVEIAALLAAADILEAVGHANDADYLRETADQWNDQVDEWTFATDPATANRLGVRGYYVRIAPPEAADAASPANGFVPIKNRPPGDMIQPAVNIISPDALALVRFGLRAADDPRIRDTVKVIDAELKCDLPQGPLWYRYNGDGYGEHEDGSPFDGTGVGRPWPLLAGERAHYELAAGRSAIARRLLATMEESANAGRLIPEQVWDGADIPERELFRGRPSGSAMPLVWAHSEHIKLLRSLADGKVFDMPPQGADRYIRRRTVGRARSWRFNNRIDGMPAGKRLRLEVLAAATVHWSADGWKTVNDTQTVANGFGIHVADLPTDALGAGAAVVFTFFWTGDRRWEGTDFSVKIVAHDPG